MRAVRLVTILLLSVSTPEAVMVTGVPPSTAFEVLSVPVSSIAPPSNVSPMVLVVAMDAPDKVRLPVPVLILLFSVSAPEALMLRLPMLRLIAPVMLTTPPLKVSTAPSKEMDAPLKVRLPVPVMILVFSVSTPEAVMVRGATA